MRGLGNCAKVVLLAAGLTTCFAVAQPREKPSELRTLTGHVFDSETQPVQKAVVYLKNTKTLALKTYITDTDGAYRFPALALNVDYEVYADFQGAHSDTKTLSAFDNRKQPVITLRIHK